MVGMYRVGKDKMGKDGIMTAAQDVGKWIHVPSWPREKGTQCTELFTDLPTLLD
jgi:hypothetical protein